MLKFGEIFLVSVEGAVVYLIFGEGDHWRRVEVASHASASRERMLIAHLNQDMYGEGRLKGYVLYYVLVNKILRLSEFVTMTNF